MVVPTGAGETRTLDPGPVVQYSRAVWDNTGRRVVFSGTDKQKSTRVYVQDVAGGPPQPVTRNDVSLGKIGRPVSPDGRRVVAVGPDGVPALYPLAGGDPVPIPGLGDQDVAICWTPNGRESWWRATSGDAVARRAGGGRERPHAALEPDRPRPPGGLSSRVLVTPDGESYAYGYMRVLSDLYLTSELRDA